MRGKGGGGAIKSMRKKKVGSEKVSLRWYTLEQKRNSGQKKRSAKR